jgi:hypothetical protein
MESDLWKAMKRRNARGRGKDLRIGRCDHQNVCIDRSKVVNSDLSDIESRQDRRMGAIDQLLDRDTAPMQGKSESTAGSANSQN